MKKLLSIFIFVSLATTTYCQETTSPDLKFNNKNSFQVELFGHGLFYSINYERIILNAEKFKASGQIGISYYPKQTGMIELWIPVLINEIISFDKHHLEMGLGFVFTNDPWLSFENGINKGDDGGGFAIGRLGYRYQKPNGRLLFRAGFTPFVEILGYNDFHPSGGLAIGYNF